MHQIGLISNYADYRALTFGVVEDASIYREYVDILKRKAAAANGVNR